MILVNQLRPPDMNRSGNVASEIFSPLTDIDDPDIRISSVGKLF
jgi:hypothetical protein